MGAMHRMQAIRQYQSSSVNSAGESASPHQLVAMLLEGALDRIARARAALRSGDAVARMANVRSAISIVEYLNLSLDHNAGSVSQRLASLYEFAVRHLTLANAAADADMLEEVAQVLRPIKQAWDELSPRAVGP